MKNIFFSAAFVPVILGAVPASAKPGNFAVNAVGTSALPPVAGGVARNMNARGVDSARDIDNVAVGGAGRAEPCARTAGYLGIAQESQAQCSPLGSKIAARATSPVAAAGAFYNSEGQTALSLVDQESGAAAAGGAGGSSGISSGPQSSGGSAMALATASNNPASTMVSVPIQPEFNFRSGPYNRMKFDTQFKPVIPLSLNKNMNLILHPTFMFYSIPRRSPQTGRKTGLGNLSFIGWLTNAKPYDFLGGKLTVGPGPAFQIPMRTSKWVDSKKFGIGPSAVYIWQQGPVLIGGFSYATWPVGNTSYKNKANSRLFSSFFIATYSFKSGFYYVSNPTFSKTWPNRGHRSWTVPVGGGVGQIFSLGKQKMKGSVQAYYNAVRPHQGARWQLRLQLTLLFPKG